MRLSHENTGKEILATVMEKNFDQMTARGKSFLNRIIAMVKRWMREHGFNVEFSREQIIELLRDTARKMEKGNVGARETDAPGFTGEPVAASIGEGETGEFGPVFRQFKGKPEEAIAHLMKVKDGEAVGALYHPEIGPIDLVWGKVGDPQKGYKGGYGLAKISAKHPEVIKNLGEIIRGSVVDGFSNGSYQLRNDKYKAAVRIEWNGKNKRWLVTAFDETARSHTGGTAPVSDATSNAPSPAPQAEPESNIPPPAGDSKTGGADKLTERDSRWTRCWM